MKHTQKIAGRLWLLALVMAIVFGFAACDDGGGETKHTHDWGEWTVTTDPTCTTAGEETRVCSHDATHVEKQPISALGHDYEWVKTTAPSLITEGEEAGTCKHDSSHTDTRATPSTPITTTEEWNTALSQISEKTGGEYTLNISGDIGVAASSFGTTAAGSSLSVTLKGTGKLYLTSIGPLITIWGNQTLIIDSKDLALQGLMDNNASVINVSYGTLELRNGTISGNTTSNNGGGVYVNAEGTFTMSGGEISGNTTSTNGGGVDVRGTFTMSGGKISGNTGGGGGVFVISTGTFTMSGGKISGNTGSGGGVLVQEYGTFTMSSGEISGNIASNNGGGVYVYASATFTMWGGKISGNTTSGASRDGGGVYVTDATFIMRGGEIFGNTASGNGGGVCVANAGRFRIVTGTIYGSDADESLKNIANSGAALYKGTFSAERGTFTGGVWNKAVDGDLDTNNNTIDVLDGDFVRR